MTYQSLGGGILICFLLNLTLVTFSSFLLRLEVSVIKPNRHEKIYKSLFFSFSHKLSTFLRNGDFLYYIVLIVAIIFLQSNCSIKNNLTIKVQTYVKINKVYFLINNIWKRQNHRIFLQTLAKMYLSVRRCLFSHFTELYSFFSFQFYRVIIFIMINKV